MKIDVTLKAAIKKDIISRLKKEENGSLILETAYPVSDNDEAAILRSFPDLKNYRIVKLVKPEIIGGFIIRQGSTIIDASLNTQVNNVVDSILH